MQVLFVAVTNNLLQYKGNVVDNQDGTYTVYYSLTNAGNYYVEVSLVDGALEAEPLLGCVGASPPFLFSRRYLGGAPYVAPAFCSLTFPILTVVHSTFYAPSCTYDDGPQQALAYGTTGVTNFFTIQSRDFFQNLREGDNTTHFAGYGDGASDFFTVEFSQPQIGYSFTVSSAINTITATGGFNGFFRLSFGGRTTQNLPSSISAVGLEAVLVSLFYPGLQVTVQKIMSGGGSVMWEIQFLTMLEVWQSMPPSGPATGAQLLLVPPLNIVADPFFASLVLGKLASRGIYPLSFTPWITGYYTVNLRSGGIDIQGSPLTLLVVPAPVDPTASISYGPGLSSAVAGTPSTFFVQARDTRQTAVQFIALQGQYAVAGFFSLAFKGERTIDLPFNASAADLRAALVALYSIGNVTVTLDSFPNMGNNGSIELTAMTLQSVWTVYFDGVCQGSGVGCPASLGDEPLFLGNTDLLAYVTVPPNVHSVAPQLLVDTALQGYGGNNRPTTASDMALIGVSLDLRTSLGSSVNSSIGMQSSQQIFCNGSSGSFTLQLLGDALTFNAAMTTASLVTVLNSSPQALAGRYQVSAVGSGATICSSAGATTDVTFVFPMPSPMPLFDLLMPLPSSSSSSNITIAISPLVNAIDSIASVNGLSGLYMLVYTPTIIGIYDIRVTIAGSDISTDFSAGIPVSPALEYAATSTHNMSQVATEGVREYFSIQLRDRFGNVVDGGLNVNSSIVVTMVGRASGGCQGLSGSSNIIPVTFTSGYPFTQGIYSAYYDPTIAGSYTVSILLRTQGGLLGTYYRSSNLTSPVLASHDALFDGMYHDPYWCDGEEPGLYSPLWQFGPISYCDPTIKTCGCDSSRLDSKLSFAWGFNSPLPNEELYSGMFPSDYFSVLWRGFLTAPGTGIYTMTVFADYGVIISINGSEVLQAVPMSAASMSIAISLTANTLSSIVISYFHQQDRAIFQILLAGPGLPLNYILDGTYLSYARQINNSPLTVQLYPGMVNASASIAAGAGLADCTSLDTCSFVVQAVDSSGNNVFNSGAENWNITISGIDVRSPPLFLPNFSLHLNPFVM